MLAGFADPVRDAQAVFRAVLAAMARPGRIVDVPGPVAVPSPLDPAAAAVCLALVDLDTPLWLEATCARTEVVEYLRFHCGARPVAAPGQARFAVVADASSLATLAPFDPGTDESPERSATVIVQIATLATGRGRRLTGPGIDGETRLDVRGLPAPFWTAVRENHARFPRGVDLILSAGTTLAALPRTTRVEA
jgi:alpha-D-ribose 1-methylphosphonate 5-triphosphate synthase subunit PhnH